MEFIQKYAKVDSDSEGEELVNKEEVRVSDQEFIDDINIFQDQDPSDLLWTRKCNSSIR